MKPYPKVAAQLCSLVLCLALTACGGGDKIRPADRAAIHTARTVPPKKGAQGNVYVDVTSKVVSQTSVAFGLAGALIGGGIAAANTKAGSNRWKNVTGAQGERVLQQLRTELEKRFAAQHGLKFPAAGPVDANLKLEFVNFGIEHLGHERFGAVVAADISMERLHPGDEGEVWMTTERALVPINASLAECQRDPRHYGAALDEAIRRLVESAVSKY